MVGRSWNRTYKSYIRKIHKSLKKILEEEYEFDSEVIDYIIEVTVKTPNNFHLGDMDSNMVVGDNDTLVSTPIY